MKKIFTILVVALSINAMAQIPTNGLVRHYTFSGNANDNVNNQHGTIIGATLTSDRFGTPNSAFYFDGVNDYIDLPLSGLMLNEYTYSVWVLANSLPASGFTSVISVGASRVGNTQGGDQSICLRSNPSMYGWGSTAYTDPNSALYTYEGIPATTMEWNHITITMSNNVQKLYLNCDLISIDSSLTTVLPYYGNTPEAKIGARETVFGVYSDKGYTWRYVPNVKIPNLKLEKIINPELHLDSEEEKAEKLQKMIDDLQDKRIKENQDAINKLKNKKG